MGGWQRLFVLLAFATCVGACSRVDPAASGPPSFLLVVLDTTRRDAVSAYGVVEDSTPYLDTLASDGLLYRWAFAPSPWTLPSHATLFTSLGAERHGVGVGGRMALGREFVTLAEKLRDAGYETVAFSENPLLSPELGFDDGFELFVGESRVAQVREQGGRRAGFDIEAGVRGWARRRDASRPFFVFVNLFDPHDPYELHEPNPFLPESVPPARAARVGRGSKPTQGVAEFAGICSRLPDEGRLAILRGLYLGEVRAADAKLATIHRALQDAAAGHLVSVVTADHGEHLGEHRLLGHEFSVRGELLRVPLVVHGLGEAEPAAIDARVGLRDVATSVLAWAGIDAPEAWAGRPLPSRPEPGGEEAVLRASFSDERLVGPGGRAAINRPHWKRVGCTQDDRVFGDLLALTRFPFKLVWSEQMPPQLYDLRWDEREVNDVASQHPERLARMTEELMDWRERLRVVAEQPVAPVAPEVEEALRALGYAE